jgi:hypothetical protein
VESFPPAIVTFEDRRVMVGRPVYLRVNAAGSELKYEWRKDGVVIPMATGPFFAMGLARPDMEGEYTVQVSNSLGSATATARVTVDPAPPGALLELQYIGARIPRGLEDGVIAYSGAFALLQDGSVVNWRVESPDRPIIATDVVAVSSSESSFGRRNLGLKRDGSVIAFDNNSNWPPIPEGAKRDVVAISCGTPHAYALKSDGTLIGWIDPFNFNYGEAQTPLAIQGGVVAVAAGRYFTLALTADGAVHSWGYGSHYVPFPMEGRKFIAIAAGGSYGVGLTEDGSVVSWPAGWQGHAWPAAVDLAGREVVSITGAGALCVDGAVVLWPNSDAPTQIIPELESGVVAIDAVSTLGIAPARPSIRRQPADVETTAGREVVLNVAAEGFPLSFQWRKDGVDIPGATGREYRLPIATMEDAGVYTVEVRSTLGTVMTEPAILTVGPAEAGTVIAWGSSELGGTSVPAAARSGVV